MENRVVTPELILAHRVRHYREQAVNGKRWCYDCEHYRTAYFCGYNEQSCRIHGSLDVDQEERHADVTADTCPDYKPNGKAPWYEKYGY